MAESPAPPAKPSADDSSTPVGAPSFLSALRALYETTKLYIALLGLIAGVRVAAKALDEQLNIHDLWISSAICLVPALFLLAWLIPKWREQLHRRRAIELGIHGRVKDPEYFRLTPYDAASDFRRADNAHEKVYTWLVGNPAPLLYLSGASGSGKSSIIYGWVLPGVAREGVPIHVVTARVVGNPITALTQALLRRDAIWGRPPADGKLGLRDLLERAARKVAPRKLLVVLDQFEEFLILADGEQRHAFTALLRTLAELPVLNLQVLMILRSDYEPLLDTLGLPQFEQDRKAVPPFFESDAMAFLRASELQISDTLESEILEEAHEVEQTPGLMRPITVNLFGLVLRRFVTLPKNYRRGTMLRSYLRELIQRKEIREFAPPILRCMMTGNGTKIPVTYTDIARAVGLDPNQIRGCLVQLANEGVVRELDREKGKWEIAHDFIAGLYHQILAGWRGSVWHRARPWIIGGGIALWLTALLTIPTFWNAWQENRHQWALLDLGLYPALCDDSDGPVASDCLMWAPTYRFKTLDAAIPHLNTLNRSHGLSLASSKVESIDPLKGLTGLEMLYLKATKVENIDALRGLTTLQTLHLNDTQVQNIDALRGLTHLRTLDLNGTKVESIAALEKLTDLQNLYLANTHVKNIDALRGLRNLRILVLDNTSVENIDSLKGLTHLQTLILNFTLVKNIDALKGLTGLQQLALHQTQVENVDALKGLTGLQLLDLQGTRVRDADALKELTNLTKLGLPAIKVQNADALKAALPKTTLSFSDN